MYVCIYVNVHNLNCLIYVKFDLCKVSNDKKNDNDTKMNDTIINITCTYLIILHLVISSSIASSKLGSKVFNGSLTLQTTLSIIVLKSPNVIRSLFAP